MLSWNLHSRLSCASVTCNRLRKNVHAKHKDQRERVYTINKGVWNFLSRGLMWSFTAGLAGSSDYEKTGMAGAPICSIFEILSWRECHGSCDESQLQRKIKCFQEVFRAQLLWPSHHPHSLWLCGSAHVQYDDCCLHVKCRCHWPESSSWREGPQELPSRLPSPCPNPPT